MSEGFTLQVHANERSTVSEVFYFGCVERVGHYYWNSNLRNVRYGDEPGPWGNHIDSTEMYSPFTHQGNAVVHHQDGWTALCIHDRTVDSRPQSHSAFLIKDTLDFDAALDIAMSAFPSIVTRIGDVTEVKP